MGTQGAVANVDVRGVRRLARRHPVATYVVLAYGISWACWAPLVLHHSTVHQGVGWPTDLFGWAGPAAAAAMTSWLIGGRHSMLVWSKRLVRWRAPRWCYGFILMTAALGLLSAALVGTDRWAEIASYTGAPNLGLAATFLLVLIVNGVGEEGGWRASSQTACSGNMTFCLSRPGWRWPGQDGTPRSSSSSHRSAISGSPSSDGCAASSPARSSSPGFTREAGEASSSSPSGTPSSTSPAARLPCPGSPPRSPHSRDRLRLLHHSASQKGAEP